MGLCCSGLRSGVRVRLRALAFFNLAQLDKRSLQGLFRALGA